MRFPGTNGASVCSPSSQYYNAPLLLPPAVARPAFMRIRKLLPVAPLLDQPVGPQKRRGSCYGRSFVCPLKSRAGPGIQCAVTLGGVEGHQVWAVQHRGRHQTRRRGRAPRTERPSIPGQHQGRQHPHGHRRGQPTPDLGERDLWGAFCRLGKEVRLNSPRGPAWFPGTQTVLQLSPVVHTLLLSRRLSASACRIDIVPPPCSARARAASPRPQRCIRARF